MIDKRELFKFIDDTVEEARAEAMYDKMEEIAETLQSGEARSVAAIANEKLEKSGLRGVTKNPADMIENLSIDGKTVKLGLSDMDDRLLRYDALHGSGIFDELDIKRTLNDAGP